jgi:hypothetical protein
MHSIHLKSKSNIYRYIIYYLSIVIVGRALEIQGNSEVPLELLNSAAQQPRQTLQKGTYQ